MSLLSDLINLDLSDSTQKITAEYIWIGGSGLDMRSKARTLAGPVTDPGYFEDRRPASNMDPYVVTSMIAETTILWKQ